MHLGRSDVETTPGTPFSVAGFGNLAADHLADHGFRDLTNFRMLGYPQATFKSRARTAAFFLRTFVRLEKRFAGPDDS